MSTNTPIDRPDTAAAAPTITVTLDETQRSLVLSALYDKLLDSKHYISGSEVDDEPGLLDNCCAGHRARYEDRKRNYRALTQQKAAVEATIALFSDEGK
ncbi:hypothetical protein [Cryobacterium zhongshanensis]|uniref:Uncharacterized protein n=1 Tax=Cryobacterium zhongshanensis TaxID=2928153 RepID=A0AA41QXW8_9MICO|nr:hypothetical protein [Cryobacterium zhongshanensis]MCI4659711.1 hypothetical protein [Cryobacterium zhongshanensis]